MCEIGWRVIVRDGRADDGLPVPPGATGVVIGHVGGSAIISLDGDGGRSSGRTVTAPDNRSRPTAAFRRAVVVHPDGRAVPLSRGDSKRVHVRPPK